MVKAKACLSVSASKCQHLYQNIFWVFLAKVQDAVKSLNLLNKPVFDLMTKCLLEKAVYKVVWNCFTLILIITIMSFCELHLSYTIRVHIISPFI